MSTSHQNPLTQTNFSFKKFYCKFDVDSEIFEKEMMDSFDPGSFLFYVYSRKEPTVSLGKYSRKYNEENAKKDGIKVVVRKSGGSPIYSDQNQLVWGTIVDANTFLNQEAAFSFACNIVVFSLNKIGINAVFEKPNDILVNNKKISGSAQFRNDKIILIHGTLIVDVDENIVNKYLIKKDTKYDGLTSTKNFGVSKKEVVDSLKNAILGH